MAKFIDKVMDMMRLNDYDDDEEQIDVREDYINASAKKQREREPEAAKSARQSFTSYPGGRSPSASTSNIVNFQASVQMEVVVIQPESYDEAQEICDHIKSQKKVSLITFTLTPEYIIGKLMLQIHELFLTQKAIAHQK